jgi:hypothetical protein
MSEEEQKWLVWWAVTHGNAWAPYRFSPDNTTAVRILRRWQNSGTALLEWKPKDLQTSDLYRLSKEGLRQLEFLNKKET